MPKADFRHFKTLTNVKIHTDGHKQKMPKPYFHKFKNHGKEKHLEMAINIICKNLVSQRNNLKQTAIQKSE